MLHEITDTAQLHEKKMLDKEYSTIFGDHHIRTLLGENVSSFNLWYYCMCHLVTRHFNKHELSYDLYNIKKILRILKPSSYLAKKQVLNEIPPAPIDILFISRDRFSKIKTQNGIVESDYLFYSLINKLKIESPHLRLGLACTSNAPTSTNICSYNIYHYIKPMDIPKAIALSIKTSTRWAKYRIRVKKQLSDQCEDSQLLFRTDLFFSFDRLFRRYLNDFAYRNLFTALSPKIIVSNDDIMQLKPATTNKDLKFIVMQSAIITPINEYYRRLFISSFGNEAMKSDYFLCSGEYYKNYKEYSSVSKQVIVTGQPRYDILSRADEVYDKGEIIQKYGLPHNKKIVLWATQTHGLSHTENLNNIESMYNAIASIDDAELVIKLHPGEDQRAALYNQCQEYKPTILGSEADINELIYLCDVLVTKNSSTALEANIIGKPVIILNLSGKPDIVNYVDEGIALGVYKESDLKTTIWRSLHDGQVIKELRLAHEKYIEKYLYKTDGRATERVVDLIRLLLPNEISSQYE